MPATPIAPYIDATGVHVSSYDAIRSWLVGQYQTIYGADIYLGNDSQDGQFVSILALMMSDWGAAVAAAYNSFSPATAQGVGLSSVVKLNGLARNIPTASQVDVSIGGTVDTAIANGVVQDAAGNKWSLPALVTIPAAGVILVTATAQQAGALQAAANTVTNIITPVRGWQTATNPTAAVPGSPVEADAALRRRQALATQLPATSAVGAILAGVGDLAGVLDAVVHENYTGAPDSAGVPAHSIAVVVFGGDVAAIASSIAVKKDPGCNLFGAISVDTLDPNGLPMTVYFSRPNAKAADVVVRLKPGAGYSSDIGDGIVAAVEAYFATLRIGQSLQFNRLWLPASLYGDPTRGSNTYELVGLTVNGASVDVAANYNDLLTCTSCTVIQV